MLELLTEVREWFQDSPASQRKKLLEVSAIEQARSISRWPSKTSLPTWCPPPDFPVSRRKIDTTLLRVATECFRGCRSFHEANKEYHPTCTKCALGVKETVEHFLLHCPGRGLTRRKHLGRTPRSCTVEQLCRERPEQIVRFLDSEWFLK